MLAVRKSCTCPSVCDLNEAVFLRGTANLWFVFFYWRILLTEGGSSIQREPATAASSRSSYLAQLRIFQVVDSGCFHQRNLQLVSNFRLRLFDGSAGQLQHAEGTQLHAANAVWHHS